MYCVKCGVKLEDTEKICPLCETEVYHPIVKQEQVPPNYPPDKRPPAKKKTKIINGVVLFLIFIPLLTSLISDLQPDGAINWFGYVAGALTLAYIAFGLPMWFKRPNPAIFVPCFFAATVAYLKYIDFVTDGDWFLSFAFPAAMYFCLIISALATLLFYLKRGKLYIWGGFVIALGFFFPLIELLLSLTFDLRFIGWSAYPFVVFGLLGGVLIYLAANRFARDAVQRRLFF
ncbi:MAG: hypothetical protein IKM32_03570 [Clostridia bacterium]|nr:hypothetical protein [Clostridia bacterium]